jgi:hypothetical protein
VPTFTAKDIARFRTARGKSIWNRRGFISANEDALVIVRYHVVEECREKIGKEIKVAEEASARAAKSGAVEEAAMFAAIAAKLSAVSSSLQELVDMDSLKKLRS